MKHANDFLTDEDSGLPVFLEPEAVQLLSFWCRTPEQVAAQNQDLLSHLGETLTGDKEAPMFLNKASINLITKWFRTPEGASECISTILNAANDSRKNAESQIGHHELYFEDYNGELKRIITKRLRRYFNKMRTSNKIKDPKRIQAAHGNAETKSEQSSSDEKKDDFKN